ncbi:MAG TPA: hypothetical protein VKM54_25365 [Myxococcota bacterium]|nr:hypothetical protein [Myxococcota bacterium]
MSGDDYSKLIRLSEVLDKAVRYLVGEGPLKERLENAYFYELRLIHAEPATVLPNETGAKLRALLENLKERLGGGGYLPSDTLDPIASEIVSVFARVQEQIGRFAADQDAGRQ